MKKPERPRRLHEKLADSPATLVMGLAGSLYSGAGLLSPHTRNGPVGLQAFLVCVFVVSSFLLLLWTHALFRRALRSNTQKVFSLRRELGWTEVHPGGSVRARFEDGDAAVTFHKNEDGTDADVVEVSLAVRSPIPFAVTREGHGEWGLRPRRDATGDAAFDGKFHVETDAGATEPFRSHAALRGLVWRAFNQLGVEQLSSRHDTLVADVASERLTPERIREIRELLGRLAPYFDRVAIDVKVLGGKRKALVAHTHGATRCSYCHEPVTGSEPDLIACGKCATVLHEGCWAELGRCPVMGCGGAVPERARTA